MSRRCQQSFTYAGGLKSWKYVKRVSPDADSLKVMACPAGQSKLAMVYELPGATVVTPKLVWTGGTVLKVVPRFAFPLSRLKSIPPFPEKVKLDVVSWLCCGKRKTNVHVLPTSAGGISKRYSVETVGVISPLNEVPKA